MQTEINVAALFAAYSQAKVAYENKLFSLDKILFSSKIIDIFLSGEWKRRELDHEQLKLALRPLSTITDEEFRHIAEIACKCYGYLKWEFGKIDRSDVTGICIDVSHNEKFIMSYYGLNFFFQEGYYVPKNSYLRQTEIIQTLMSWGFDMGYMGIRSLIQDGRFAVDINNIQK